MSHNEGNGPDEDRDVPEIGDADLRQMGMTSRTFTSRSARCPAGSDNVWGSLAPCISAPGC
jgi:hypothetical protein